MAVKFLTREECNVRMLAVEKLNLLYNLLTTILIIIFFNRLHHPQEMLMGRFLGVGVVLDLRMRVMTSSVNPAGTSSSSSIAMEMAWKASNALIHSGHSARCSATMALSSALS